MLKNILKKYPYFWLRILNLFLILGVCVSYQKIATRRMKAEEKILSQSRLEGNYKNGTYEGVGQGFGGDIKVKLVIKNNTIQKLEIIEAKKEDTAYLKNAKKLTTTIVQKQTTDVDVVSGATYSSKGIIEATKQALKEAS